MEINYNIIQEAGGVKGKNYRGGFQSGGIDAGRVKRSGFGLELKLGLVCVWLCVLKMQQDLSCSKDLK